MLFPYWRFEAFQFQGILENGTDGLSRNAGKELTLLTAYWHRRAQFLFASRRLLACVMNSFHLIVVVSKNRRPVWLGREIIFLVTASNTVQINFTLSHILSPNATFCDSENKLYKEMRLSSIHCSRLSTKYSDIWYDIKYLLTAIGLPLGGSSTVHIYTQKIHITTHWNRIHRTEHT